MCLPDGGYPLNKLDRFQGFSGLDTEISPRRRMRVVSGMGVREADGLTPFIVDQMACGNQKHTAK